MNDEDLLELKKEFESFRKDVELQIQGNLEGPGIASRLQSCEGELKRHDFAAMDKRLVLLEDNRIKDGQVRMNSLEEKVKGQSKIAWTIGSIAISAVVTAIIGAVIKS